MARTKRSTAPPQLEYAGEVWTDARGRATVTLPKDARAAAQPLRYELRAADARIGARVLAELREGRFTIETDEPHVRVQWRARTRAVEGEARREET